MRSDLKTFRRARDLRRSLTRPEAMLWINLSRRRLDGLHFRRQHPLGPYILDFYCAEARLAVEVDGESHGFGTGRPMTPAATPGAPGRASSPSVCQRRTW